jgi:hypothetical protein
MTSFANHEALRGLDTEQLAELALYGLRYRALGAKDIDFSKPDRLDVYWTGERMVKDVVKKALKAVRARAPLAEDRVSEAVGHLQALFNCSVIDDATYTSQFQLLLDRHKTKPS